jgi:hypothetical protein
MSTWIIGVIVCLLATQAWAQEPSTRPETPTLWSTTPSTTSILRESGPPVTSYPGELMGLLSPPAERGPITLRPGIGLSFEYDDNVNGDNSARESDVIFRYTPALALTVNRPDYQLSAGYTLSGEYRIKAGEFEPAQSHAFVGTGVYSGVRGMTFTLADSFVWSRNSDQFARQGFSTGSEQDSWTNTFTPGMTWEFAPRWLWTLSANIGVQRFVDGDSTGTGTSSAGVDSNSYNFQTGVEYAFTRRLTGTAGYSFTYLDFMGEDENSSTHNPNVGFRYLVTPRLTASLSAGPLITHLAGETVLSWGGTARLLQVFQIGSAYLEYSRGVSAAGGLGGTTHTDTFTAGVLLPTWYRGLVLAFTPSYRMAESVGSQQTSSVDVKSLTLPLSVSYQLTRYASLFLEYTFFQQRPRGSSSTEPEIDQNRVRFGIQVGYPFNFD